LNEPLTLQQKLELLRYLSTDFEAYASRVLKILPKAGGAPVPLVLNNAQAFLHRKIQQQLAETGRVRALVLKGRQQGISTYTEGRFYWRLTHSPGKRAIILTHEQKATDNLFSMVARYWENAPPRMRPHLGKSNEKELVFDLLGSRYEVSTAGARNTGRSITAQYFHGSEMAFWPFAAQHLAGIGQVVPQEPGTEIIHESTANGTANVFHELWQLAVKGRSEFLPVFIPWFWQTEYQSVLPAGFELTAEEEEYREAFDLRPEQMAWRRAKTDTDFRGDGSLFDQEYPASPDLAFASSSPRSLIKAAWVAKARRSRGLDAIGPKIMAVDVAEYGDDSTSVMWRQGRVAKRLGKWNGLGTMETVGRVGLIADREKPDVIFVDATGVGTGVADRLLEEGYPVVRIHFGESPRDVDRYVLTRDELWGEMSDWLQDEPASIDDDDDLAAQLCAVQYGYDSKRRLKLEPKEKMKDRGLSSPDDGDALALTFARGATARHAQAAAYRRLRGFHRDDD
jgi:hypothetical protein